MSTSVMNYNTIKWLEKHHDKKVIGQNLVREERLHQLKGIFDSLDADHSGTLEIDEIAQAANDLMRDESTTQGRQRSSVLLFSKEEEPDADSDSAYSDFELTPRQRRASSTPPSPPSPNAQEQREKENAEEEDKPPVPAAGVDAWGSVQREYINVQEMLEKFNEMDADKSGSIDFEEFLAVMTSDMRDQRVFRLKDEKEAESEHQSFMRFTYAYCRKMILDGIEDERDASEDRFRKFYELFSVQPFSDKVSPEPQSQPQPQP
uniref:EF-hand domain-containing protein n=1 Tax=Phaeomonas parva TaxID=124430 RepID=A0A7S1XNQ2_9STRA